MADKYIVVATPDRVRKMYGADKFIVDSFLDYKSAVVCKVMEEHLYPDFDLNVYTLDF